MSNTSFQYAFILGNTPQLAAWEILSVLKRNGISVSDILYINHVLFLRAKDFDAFLLMAQLGGTIKIVRGEMIQEIDMRYLTEKALTHEGKITFAISWYRGSATQKIFNQRIKKYRTMGKDLKRLLKQEKKSVRFLDHQTQVSSAVLLKNNFVKKGIEFVFIHVDNEYFFGTTCAFQDIRAFQERDVDKPFRSMDVGMMPPKLARMMINVADMSTKDVLLDPFCGMGTILIEAASLGFKKMYGSDIQKNQVNATKENIKWFQQTKNMSFLFDVKTCDSRNVHQCFKSIDFIVTEPFLGRILYGHEKSDVIQKQIVELEQLYLETFRSLHACLTKKGKIVMIIPQFSLHQKKHVLQIHDRAMKIGFKQIFPPSFLGREIIYSRKGQKVIREICVFEKK